MAFHKGRPHQTFPMARGSRRRFGRHQWSGMAVRILRFRRRGDHL